MLDGAKLIHVDRSIVPATSDDGHLITIDRGAK